MNELWTGSHFESKSSIYLPYYWVGFVTKKCESCFLCCVACGRYLEGKTCNVFFHCRHCSVHCWKILLILVLGKVASKTQYSHFVICKVWVLGFTHHFTLHPLIWQIFSLISWLYFSTMWILWGRKCDYWVFHITHAKKGLPNHSSSTRDLKDFFSICDVENTILTYPPHSILSLPFILNQYWQFYDIRATE